MVAVIIAPPVMSVIGVLSTVVALVFAVKIAMNW
jgi:hypothetical protein